jgi:hypothetical protein
MPVEVRGRLLTPPLLLQSPHAMKCPILKVKLAGFKEAQLCPRTIKIACFLKKICLCANDDCMCNFDHSFYLISSPNVEFLFPPTSYAHLPSSIKILRSFEQW